MGVVYRWIGIVGSVVVFASGCKSTIAKCTAACEKTNKCPGVVQDPNCAQSCDTANTKADQAGCGKQFATAQSCLNDSADVCDVHSNGCDSQVDDYKNCFLGFCKGNPASDACKP